MAAPSFKSTHVPDAECPSCHHHLDACTDPTGEYTPRPGDGTLCLYCGVVLIFDEQLIPSRVATAEEIAQCDPVLLSRGEWLVREFQKQRKGKKR